MDRQSLLDYVIADSAVEPRFRWVDCQLDVLQDCVNLPMLEKALDSLPSTIGETYIRTLLNIKDSSRSRPSEHSSGWSFRRSY